MTPAITALTSMRLPLATMHVLSSMLYPPTYSRFLTRPQLLTRGAVLSR